MKNAILLTFSLILLACTAPQRPYHFALMSSKPQALASVRTVLAEQGHEVEYVDEDAGIVRTRWVDTGFLMGEVQGMSATVVRRYTVIFSENSAGGLNVVVRADTKKCAQDGFEVSGEMVTGACEVMVELAGPHQEELNALGVSLQNGVR